MHHVDPVNALEMLPVKGVDGPDPGRAGKGDDPGVYKIYCCIAKCEILRYAQNDIFVVK